MAVVRHVPGNHTQISIAELSKSSNAFGDLRTTKFTPTCGWMFANGLNTQIVTTATTGSGTATVSGSMINLSTTAAINSSASVQTNRNVRYIAGQGALVRLSAIFTAGAVGSQQIVGVGDAVDGLFFGYNGATFGILHRNNGVDTWVAKNNWNLDRADGTTPTGLDLDPTKGNVYQIQYQWLGFGDVAFSVVNKETGRFVDVHRIKYANANTSVSLTNPVLPILAEATNTSNASNIVVKSASAIGGADADDGEAPLRVHHTFDGSKLSVTSEQPIFTIRNSTTFGGATNTVFVGPEILAIAADGNKPTFIRGYTNPTITSTSQYVALSTGTSVVQTNTVSTSATGGTLVFSVPLAKAGQMLVDAEGYSISLKPGEHFTITGQSSVASDVYVSLTWEEFF